MTKRDFELINKIVDRAEAESFIRDSRLNHMLDVRVAYEQFNIRLDDWLNADIENFAHDWFGIYAHTNRGECKVVDLFVPRFAGKEVSV